MRMLGGLAMVVMVSSAARAVNYVPNAGFESCSTTPASWAAVGTEALACDGTTPAGGSYDLALSNGTNAMLARAQSDCVVGSPGTSIDDFSFAYRTSAVAAYAVALTVDFFTTSDCTGTSASDSVGAGLNYGATLMRDGAWHATTPRTATIDPGINSIRFTASFQAQAAQLTSTVDFDDLSFSTNGTTSTTEPSGTTTTTSVGGTTTSTTVPTFTGKGNPASECFVTVTGLAAKGDGQVDCVDGDPACDADGVADGECVVRLPGLYRRDAGRLSGLEHHGRDGEAPEPRRRAPYRAGVDADVRSRDPGHGAARAPRPPPGTADADPDRGQHRRAEARARPHPFPVSPAPGRLGADVFFSPSSPLAGTTPIPSGNAYGGRRLDAMRGRMSS